ASFRPAGLTRAGSPTSSGGTIFFRKSITRRTPDRSWDQPPPAGQPRSCDGAGNSNVRHPGCGPPTPATAWHQRLARRRRAARTVGAFISASFRSLPPPLPNDIFANMFTGAITALVTPMRGGRVDDDAMRRLVDEQIAAGIDGLVAVGT